LEPLCSPFWKKFKPVPKWVTQIVPNIFPNITKKKAVTNRVPKDVLNLI